MVLPSGTANKKESVWDDVKEFALDQDEIEELFENKVSYMLALSPNRRKKQQSVQMQARS